jgi:hypothetical protein
MPYTITHFDGYKRKSEPCADNLIAARRRARQFVKDGGGRAEVRDAFGDLVFEFGESGPRT